MLQPATQKNRIAEFLPVEHKNLEEKVLRNELISQQQQLSPHRIQQRAKELLLIDPSQVQIPEVIYANAEGEARKQIRENYLRRRNFILKTLGDGKTLYKSYDADGTVTFKTVQKVENSRSIGSLQDKYFLRMLLKACQKLGAYFEINTARTGFIPGPSVVGTEGPKFRAPDGKLTNVRAPNEISGLLHEFGIHYLDDADSHKLFDKLVINGLSGGVRHDPTSKKLEINPATTRYGEFINALNEIKLPNAPNGFLSELEKIVENKNELKPLKVFEYKSIPWVFVKNPDFTVEQYLKYITLVEKSRHQKLSSTAFFQKLNESGIKLPQEYYDPSKPPASEEELTRKMRLAMVACITPHAFDSDNVIRSDKKIEFYKTLAKFSRSPAAQEWAEKTYGIPKGTDLFTVNGKSVEHVDFDNFEKQYKSLVDLIKELKDKGKNPKNKEHVLVNLVDNEPQPYLEIAPNSSKADVLPDITTVAKNNFTVIGAGDSPGSDAVMLAQAIILGGAGFIVRGLMTSDDVAKKIVEQLALQENQWHPLALTQVGENEKGEPLYKLNKSGEVNNKNDWAKFFLEKFEDRIFRCNNIHENNAFSAAVFSEFFAGDKDFNLHFNESDKWAQDVIKNTCVRSLVTPVSEAAEHALENHPYEQCVLDKYPFLRSIPVVRDIFDPMKAGKTFDRLLGTISNVLIGAAPVEIIADKLGAGSLAQGARLIQRIAYGINTVASGVSRGLFLSSHKFYWQFIGEVFGLASTFFPTTSTFGRTLRAINQSVLLGRANELAMRTNYNLDDFAKDKKTEQEVKEAYTSDAAKPYKEKRVVAAKLTQDLMKNIDYLSDHFMGGVLGKLPFGKVLVTTGAQFMQASKMAWDFVRIPALRKHTLANFFSFGQSGIAKMSKNSGKSYGEVHEENVYAFTGMATLGTALLSAILGKVTGNHNIDKFLTNVANMIPALGIVTAGKLVHQDQAGDPRVFTDVAKNQVNYSPEKAGKLQMISGWMMAIFGAFQHTTTGSVLYNLANGIYFKGIREQLKVGIDDSAVNKLTRQGKYYLSVDGRNGNNRSNGSAMAQAA